MPSFRIFEFALRELKKREKEIDAIIDKIKEKAANPRTDTLEEGFHLDKTNYYSQYNALFTSYGKQETYTIPRGDTVDIVEYLGEIPIIVLFDCDMIVVMNRGNPEVEFACMKNVLQCGKEVRQIILKERQLRRCKERAEKLGDEFRGAKGEQVRGADVVMARSRGFGTTPMWQDMEPKPIKKIEISSRNVNAVYGVVKYGLYTDGIHIIGNRNLSDGETICAIRYLLDNYVIPTIDRQSSVYGIDNNTNIEDKMQS